MSVISSSLPEKARTITGEALQAALVDLVDLSLPEIRRLLNHLIWTEQPEHAQVLRRSRWRRRHQHRARQCHYRARGHLP